MSLFSFLRRGPDLARLFPDGVDCHSHLLPGVDDGVPTLEAAGAAIAALRQAGLRGVCCTPHIMQRYPNTVADLRARFAVLRQSEAAVGFPLWLGAEYMLDEGFPKHLLSGDLLVLPGGKLLVELPQYMLPEGWMDLLLQIRERGLTPLLAHPERYLRLLSPADAAELTERGILLQGNLGSLTGFYGRHVQSFARELLRKGLYHCWGTDTHSADMARRVLRLP